MTASPRPSHRSSSSRSSGSKSAAARQGWPITPTPVSVWVTGSLRSGPGALHRLGFGEPPCTWTWSTLLWETIITSYAHPGGRVAVTDPADDIQLQTTLNRTQHLRSLLPGQTAPADPRIRSRGPVDLLIVPPPCLHLHHELVGEDPEAQGVHDRVLEKQLLALTGYSQRIRPGGVVAVLTRITPDPAGAADRIGPLIEQARALGLTYLQHHPVIHALVRDGRIGPTNSSDEPSQFSSGRGEGAAASFAERAEQGTARRSLLHRAVHSDLLVFRRPAVADDQPGGDL